MQFTKEQMKILCDAFPSSTTLAIYFRDELKMPATEAKSLAWSVWRGNKATQQEGEDEQRRQPASGNTGTSEHADAA